MAQAQRGELLKYVGVDNKFNICIESQYRDVVKPIAQCISALNIELAKYEGLITSVKGAAAELSLDPSSLWDKHGRYEGQINSLEATLKKGILQGVLTKERSDALEAEIAGLKSKLKRHDEVIAPISAKIAVLPEVTLAAPQR